MITDKHDNSWGWQTHAFDPSLAVEIGLDRAVLYNRIVCTLMFTPREYVSRFEHTDGREYEWMKMSVRRIARMLPYMSKSSIQRDMAFLVENGYLLSGEFNAEPYDKTKWYALPRK